MDKKNSSLSLQRKHACHFDRREKSVTTIQYLKFSIQYFSPLIVAFFILVSCTENKQNKVESSNVVKDTLPAQTITPLDTTNCNQKINDAIGFLKMGDTDAPFILKNLKRDTAIKVNFNNLQTKNKFFPLAFHRSYHLLVFRCVEYERGNYKIVVNETSNKTMLLPDTTRAFKFLSWTEHILDACCIDFDNTSNPLREAKNDKAKIINRVKDEIYFPVKIEGDWLQVKWGEEKNWKYAWILWKSGTCVLIDVLYFA